MFEIRFKRCYIGLPYDAISLFLLTRNQISTNEKREREERKRKKIDFYLNNYFNIDSHQSIFAAFYLSFGIILRLYYILFYFFLIVVVFANFKFQFFFKKKGNSVHLEKKRDWIVSLEIEL